jgi:prepilin-type N-terminal cleavage/methylation domain-containing protein
MRLGDEGFTLVELIVAFFIFAVVSTATVYGLTSALHASSTNESRVVAANLASRQIEVVRAKDANDIVEGHTVEEFVVDGDPYTIEQWAEYDTVSGNASPCAGSDGRVAFKRVTVQVTWPNMGQVKPVRSDTVKSLPVTGVNRAEGIVTVGVKDRNGVPVAGHNVQILRGAVAFDSGTTRTDGCVVFQEIAPGEDYYAVLDAADYIDKAGQRRAVSSAINVVEGFVTKYPGFSYDRAATITATIRKPDNVPLAVGGYPLTLGNTILPGGVASASLCGTIWPCRTGPDAGPYTVNRLFPVTDGYTAWLGSCVTARPLTGGGVPVEPGATSDVNLPSLGAVRVLSSKGVGHNLESLIAVNADCRSEIYEFPGDGGVAPIGVTAVALPAGSWDIADKIQDVSKPKKFTRAVVVPGTITAVTDDFK